MVTSAICLLVYTSTAADPPEGHSLRWFKEREKHLFFIAYPVLVFLVITFLLLIKCTENELHLRIELRGSIYSWIYAVYIEVNCTVLCIYVPPPFVLKINKNRWRKKGQKKSCVNVCWFKIKLIRCICHEAALYTSTNTKCFLLASCVRLMWDYEQSGLLGFMFSEAFKSQVKT